MNTDPKHCKILINFNRFQVTGLSQYTVVQISAGANHSLAVDEWGSLFRDTTTQISFPSHVNLKFNMLKAGVDPLSFFADLNAAVVF